MYNVFLLRRNVNFNLFLHVGFQEKIPTLNELIRVNRVYVREGSLVFLYSGISTFMGYLKPKPSL